MASSTSDLGRTDRLHHHIDTGNSPPIRQPVCQISPHRREEVRELLSQILERGVVEPSSSPWASPIVLVQKKDGSTRFCIDYRKLNHMTRKETYPLPRIDMTLDTLHGLPLTSSAGTGRSKWPKPTRTRQLSAQPKGCSSSGSCPSGCVTLPRCSNDSWT